MVPNGAGQIAGAHGPFGGGFGRRFGLQLVHRLTGFGQRLCQRDHFFGLLALLRGHEVVVDGTGVAHLRLVGLPAGGTLGAGLRGVLAGGGLGRHFVVPLVGGQKATITDPEITRYRPRIIIAEDVTTAEGASRRGQWQKQRSLGEGTQTEITVAGWRIDGLRGDAGALWRINRLAPIKDELQGLDVTWLIVSVTFIEDDKQGREAVINLMPREAMLIPAEVAKKQTKQEATW